MNASGPTILNSATSSAFYAAPIRSTVVSTYNTLVYNTALNEIQYNTIKTFVIDHPVDKSKYLVHACLEGAETGVYYRGKGSIINNISATIRLPDYVDKLATDFTIQVTHIYDGTIKQYSATSVKDNSFEVYGENGAFYWHVNGCRGKIEVEPFKSVTQVKGDGPYRYILHP